MLYAVRGFSRLKKNGLFINSCFAHCQTERQDTWFSPGSPHIKSKARPFQPNLLFSEVNTTSLLYIVCA